MKQLNKNNLEFHYGVLKLYKNRGETPLECINRFKKDNSEYKDEKMTYAGRLDPLAEGLLLVLVGEECKNKEEYLGLDKEYEVTVLFGFATDSFDVLGIVCDNKPLTNADLTRKNAEPPGSVIPAKAGIHPPCHPRECLAYQQAGGDPSALARSVMSFLEHGYFLARKFLVLAPCLPAGRQSRSQVSKKNIISLANINSVLQSFVGKFSQKYPPFSSKTVNGIPLFAHAKSGNLDPDEIPSKDVEIKNIKLLSEDSISKSELEEFVKESIALVSGDFRQEEILKSWESALSRLNLDNFQTITIKVSCTSGTYMRSLANSIGEKVGVPTLALNIKRIKIGKSQFNK